MIPESFIEDWRTQVKWQTLAMIEQDLIISRALICLYKDPKIKSSLIFRGGTALNKLYLKPVSIGDRPRLISIEFKTTKINLS